VPRTRATSEPASEVRRTVLFVLSLAVLAVGAVALTGWVPGEVADVVRGFGAAAPVAFVVLYVALSLLLIPSSVLALTAGVLFGVVAGASLAFVGGAVSAAVGFVVGRRFGRGPIERLVGRRLEVVNRWLRRHGVVTVAIARNVPALPFGLVNYAAGCTGIPARRFLLGTVLGIVPGTVAYASFGGSLHDVMSARFVLAVALLIVVVVGGALAERHIERRERVARRRGGEG
jgi:uncharacterized membrane protein YdjX (TVP38/TMEM64 family)